MSEESSNPSELYKIFSNALKKDTERFKGDFWEIIRLAPDFFELFVNMYRDPAFPADTKHIINATITYFVVPSDVLPEETYGAIGYLDDLYLCVWAIQALEDKVGFEVIEKKWNGNKDLRLVVEEVYKKTHPRMKDIEEDILEFVGLE